MLSKSRVLRLASLTAAIVALGCNTTTPTSTDQISDNAVVKPAEVTSPSPVGSGVHGTVTGPDGNVVAGAAVSVDDARIIEVTNGPEGVTGSDGTYSLHPVPGKTPWLVVANVNGTRMANIFLPTGNPTKDAVCDITLASSLATAGIAPYFAPDPSHPDALVFDLRDLPVDKFVVLVNAVQTHLPQDAKPGQKLRDLFAPFNALKDQQPDVQTAYNDLMKAVAAAQALRAAGGSPLPVASVSQVGPGSSPTASAPNLAGQSLGASPSASPSTTAASASPGASPAASPSGGATASPSASPSTAASPTTKPNPIIVTLGTAPAPTTTSGHMDMSPIDTTVYYTEGMAASATLDPLLSSQLSFNTDNTIAAKSVAFSSSDKKPYYLVGNTIVHNGTTVTMDGVDPNATTDLAIADSTTAYVSLAAANVIKKVDLTKTSGGTTDFTGTSGAAGDQVDGDHATARFNQPKGLAIFGAKMYVADATNAAIRVVNLGDGSVQTLAGTKSSPGADDGTGSSAHFGSPTDVTVDRDGNIYVADQANNVIREVTQEGVVTTIAGTHASGDVDCFNQATFSPGTTPGTLAQPTSIAWTQITTPLGAKSVLVVQEYRRKIRLITGW